MGPTAAGKSALALALHERLPVDLISVDAAQVYRGMDVGTAKPSLEEQRHVPHRLIDIRDPAESYSAAEFCVDALAAMEEIVARRRLPLLVGGTMFYFRALEAGLSALPPADGATRALISEEAKMLGWPGLHRRLAEADPETAARIAPNDRQRIQRALEILRLTGEPPSRLNRSRGRAVFPYRPIKVIVSPRDRGVLHARIAVRFQKMLEKGFVAEVETLMRRGDLRPELPSMRAVGYRQVWQYLTEIVSYSQMVDAGIAASRQLAKRQLTWLRADEQSQWFDGTDTQLLENSVRFIEQQLRHMDAFF